MNIIEKLEEKRCGKCPSHYGGFNGEDYDDGCIINPDYGYKMCWNAFLPRFIINILISKENEAEERRLEEYMENEYIEKEE